MILKKTILLLGCLLLLTGLVRAQKQDTIYYNIAWKICARDTASYFRTWKRFPDRLYHITDHYRNGRVQMTGVLKALDPEYREGAFVYYDSSGRLYSREQYHNNLLEGRADAYYPSGTKWVGRRYHNGKPIGSWEYYTAGGKHGRSSVFFDSVTCVTTYYDTLSGKPVATGNMRRWKKTGSWCYYYGGGTGLLFKEATYTDGLLDGAFRVYDSSCGNLLISCRYVKGKREGEWRFYGSCDTAVTKIVTYVHGQKNGPIRVYDPASGLLLREGNDEQDEETGEWTYYFKGTHKVRMVRHYRNGNLDGSLISYFENGNIRRREEYEHDVMIHWNCYGVNGGDTMYYRRFEKPVLPGDPQSMLRNQILYPEKALVAQLEGKVLVRISIDGDGRIYDAETVSSTNEVFNEEAERVARMLPVYVPAMEDGTPVDASVILPVVFSLQDVQVYGSYLNN